MSIEAMHWAMKQQLVPDPSLRHLLLCLADSAQDDGDGAFPSIHTLQLKTGMSEQTVRRGLKKLILTGLVESGDVSRLEARIKRQDRRPNCYRILIDVWTPEQLAEARPARAAEQAENPTPAQPDEAERGAKTGCQNGVPKRGAKSTGCQNGGVRGATAVAPNPSFNHPKERGAAADAPPPGGVEEQPPQRPPKRTLAEWLSELKTIGKAAVPESDEIFDYAEKLGLSADLLELAWAKFSYRYQREQPDKRERDWRWLFRKAVRDDWFGLWAPDGDGHWRLTPKGVQARIFHGAEVAR